MANAINFSGFWPLLPMLKVAFRKRWSSSFQLPNTSKTYHVEVRNGASISGGRFLLVSPTLMVRFQCSFQFLVACSGLKKSWKFQDVEFFWISEFEWITWQWSKNDTDQVADWCKMLVSPKWAVWFRCCFQQFLAPIVVGRSPESFKTLAAAIR